MFIEKEEAVFDLFDLFVFLAAEGIVLVGAIAEWLDYRTSTPDPVLERLHENLNQDLDLECLKPVDLECLKPIEIDIGGQKYRF